MKTKNNLLFLMVCAILSSCGATSSGPNCSCECQSETSSIEDDGTEAFLLYATYTWPETGELCYAIEDADQGYDFSAYENQMFTVPYEHKGLPVYIINDRAFDYCASIVVLDLRGVRYIGSQAFVGCTNIRNVAISGGTTVAPDAFPSQAQLWWY